MANPIVEALEKTAAFRVDAYCEGYPDVIFEIILNAVPTPEQVEAAVNTLTVFFTKYNRKHIFRPIHYVSDAEDASDGDHPRGIYVHIDFGNASPWALIEAVQALEKSELPIFRVALL